jgi:hypothetical protein
MDDLVADDLFTKRGELLPLRFDGAFGSGEIIVAERDEGVGLAKAFLQEVMQ